MATNRTFSNMLNQKPGAKKPMSEDDMAVPAKKTKQSTYLGMMKKEKK